MEYNQCKNCQNLIYFYDDWYGNIDCKKEHSEYTHFCNDFIAINEVKDMKTYCETCKKQVEKAIVINKKCYCVECAERKMEQITNKLSEELRNENKKEN